MSSYVKSFTGGVHLRLMRYPREVSVCTAHSTVLHLLPRLPGGRFMTTGPAGQRIGVRRIPVQAIRHAGGVGAPAEILPSTNRSIGLLTSIGL